MVKMNEEKVLEALVDFASAIESACVQLKQYVKEQQGVGLRDNDNLSDEDYNKLYWDTKEGAKGKYQQTSKAATNNHGAFQQLQQKLRERNGYCIIGSYKYWFHQRDENVIDRRPK